MAVGIITLVAGLACVLGSYHLGCAHGMQTSADMTEEALNMMLDCIREGNEIVTQKLDGIHSGRD